MPLYSVEGSEKKRRRIDSDFRIWNKKTDDEMKGARNNRTKRKIKKVEELDNKGMVGSLNLTLKASSYRSILREEDCQPYHSAQGFLI